LQPKQDQPSSGFVKMHGCCGCKYTLATIIKIMRKIFLTTSFVIIIFGISYSQLIVRQTSQWKTYKGKLIEGKTKTNIELSLLFLDEGYIVGTLTEIQNNINHKIVGRLESDSLILNIRNHDTDIVEGLLLAVLQNKDNVLYGCRKSTSGMITASYKLKRSLFSSYTDYLMKFRALHESTTIAEALQSPNDVLAIDLANQGINSLPDEFSKLKKLISINLRGNKFIDFPIVLTKLRTIEEISLSSNGLERIPVDIGKLRNLRVLILNFNHLTELPKEMGLLHNLLYLDIGDNQLKTIPEELRNLTNLQELHVDDNLLTDFEKERLKRLLPNCTIYYK
jgi:hypothetical protein